MECGVDEVARGCLFGRVYAGAVSWPVEALAGLPDTLPKGVVVRDSKKMSHSQRVRAAEWIKRNAAGWGVAYRTAAEIDATNILQAALAAMRGAIDALAVAPDTLAIDGTQFAPCGIPHRCIPQGDRHHFGISCAAILAKVEHDAYVTELCRAEPWLDIRYGLTRNMGYGTKAHLDGIKRHGVSPEHRRSFRPCADAPLATVPPPGSIERLQACVRGYLQRSQESGEECGFMDVNRCCSCNEEIAWESQICGRCARNGPF